MENKNLTENKGRISISSGFQQRKVLCWPDDCNRGAEAILTDTALPLKTTKDVFGPVFNKNSLYFLRRHTPIYIEGYLFESTGLRKCIRLNFQ